VALDVAADADAALVVAAAERLAAGRVHPASTIAPAAAKNSRLRMLSDWWRTARSRKGAVAEGKVQRPVPTVERGEIGTCPSTSRSPATPREEATPEARRHEVS
jgi:hypothetical protein